MVKDKIKFLNLKSILYHYRHLDFRFYLPRVHLEGKVYLFFDIIFTRLRIIPQTEIK